MSIKNQVVKAINKIRVKAHSASAIPQPDPPFEGVIGKTADESTPDKPEIIDAPPGAPNVVIVLLDDVGFGAAEAFGGPVPMPALSTVVNEGIKYNQFHTTALCSPTRAALLTGRNHHSVGFGAIAEIAIGYPGYNSVIPRSKATIGRILQGNGYNTSWFGKNHITPAWEWSPAGPFDRWPTGLGFERFYGFMGGEASQWYPSLTDQTTPVNPAAGKSDYYMEEDLADKAIEWIQQQKATGPNKPFLMYFSPGATHAPHHAPQEFIDKFKGQFDDGWDALREQTYQRQLANGVIPPGTKITPRPMGELDENGNPEWELPAWEDYDEELKPVATRLMECYAGMLNHVDYQVGRIIQTLKDMGQWDNTLFIYIVGDNGASGEGTIDGTWNASAMQNGIPESKEILLAHLDDFGSAHADNHFNVGWAWALNSPLPWMKQVASHFGGTRNGMAISWPQRIAHDEGFRSQFHHVIDIVPTILTAVGIEPPTEVSGIAQEPIEGTSMVYTFDNPDSPSQRKTQYFEILANRAIYHDGWIASCFHGRPPWVRSQDLPVFGEQEVWELYNIEDDFSQSMDLAAAHPKRLAELQKIFDHEAQKYNVYPLDGSTTMRSLSKNRPSLLEGVKKFTYYPGNVSLPELTVVNMKNCSFEMVAHLSDIALPVEGVVVCQGGSMAGWTLYVDEQSHPVYYYNYVAQEFYAIRSSQPLPTGDVQLKVVFDYDGIGLGLGGTAKLFINDEPVGEGRVDSTVPFVFSMSGETFDVGTDTCEPVGPYGHDYRFTGTIEKVEIEVGSLISELPDWLREKFAKGLHNAMMGSQ